MKVLVLSPTPTAPQNYGNRVRIHRVMSALKAKRHEVDLLYYPAEHDWRNRFNEEAMRQMTSEWNITMIVPPSRPLHADAVGEDHLIDEWWDDAIGDYLKWLFSRKDYDIFIVNYTWLSKALEYAPKSTMKVLDTHDVFSGRREILERAGVKPEFFHTTKEQEIIGLHRADLVLAIKKEEEAFFRRVGVTHVDTLIHADKACKLPSRPKGQLPIFGIFGAANNLNVYNITRFVEVADRIFRNFLCPLEVHIYGSVCRDLDHLKRFSFVKLQGFVEHQDEFYKNVDAVLIPMENSTGLKIKSAEALAYGSPIIAHAHAFEGLPAHHPYHVLPSYEALAEAALSFAYDEDLRNSLQVATRRAQVAALKQFDGAIDRMLERRVKMLPRNIMVLNVEQISTVDDLDGIWGLITFLGYKYDIGVLIAGNSPMLPMLLDRLSWSNIYSHLIPNLDSISADEFSRWMNLAELVISNAATIGCYIGPNCRKMIYDARFSKLLHLPENLGSQTADLYVLHNKPVVGGLGFRRKPKRDINVTNICVPTKFWKLQDLDSSACLDWAYLQKIGAFADNRARPELITNLHRSMSSDAGWAKLWRLM